MHDKHKTKTLATQAKTQQRVKFFFQNGAFMFSIRRLIGLLNYAWYKKDEIFTFPLFSLNGYFLNFIVCQSHLTELFPLFATTYKSREARFSGKNSFSYRFLFISIMFADPLFHSFRNSNVRNYINDCRVHVAFSLMFKTKIDYFFLNKRRMGKKASCLARI